MESNMIECPIDEEWKFHKADLLPLKHKENGSLYGKSYYAYNIPGVQYFLSIYLNGNRDEQHKETWIFLHVNGSKERNVIANFIFLISSSQYESKSLEYAYQHFEGWGVPCAKTDDLFESNKKFFVNGEITVRIKGTLKVAYPLIDKLSCPISMQWKIKESDLEPFKEKSNYGCLQSTCFVMPSFFNVKYYLEIYPNGNNTENKEHTWVILQIEIGNVKKIEAVYDFSIKSNYSCNH